MKSLWDSLLQPDSMEEALVLLKTHGTSARIIAGGTDVIVELSRGMAPTSVVIDISRLRELDGIALTADSIVLGALATHNDVISSPECFHDALPLVQACAEIGAPQLRTRATIAGNIATASPANDTISALIALDATIHLRALDRRRSLPIESFITGFRKTGRQPDELIESISIPRMKPNQRGVFCKIGLRRAQAISVIHFATVVEFDDTVVTGARIAMGCVAPTVIRASKAEAFLAGRELTSSVAENAASTAAAEASPIDDVRGSGKYRSRVLERTLGDALVRLAEHKSRSVWTTSPVLLDSGADPGFASPVLHDSIETTVNGVGRSLSSEAIKGTLLNAIRDGAGLTGSKEGCAEGECGACTMWLDGQAVMSCLVPAAQAHGRNVTTIEGLAATSGRPVHPLQTGFVESAAVQCGFCIPGMVMAGAKLQQERPSHTRDDVKTALSGNLCRCTGYAKIIDAMHQAATTNVE